ncbi:PHEOPHYTINASE CHLOROPLASTIC [Salix koriyanagi]|uniref:PHEOPHYTINASE CHLOROPLASTIC n=1 Tax=Salix koriyanagi TaxID=2511006 RepID=A0A9Q0X2B0_9ROSI|nr:PHEOPHYTINASE CHLOROPLASTIC [Salix koriyanagi]
MGRKQKFPSFLCELKISLIYLITAGQPFWGMEILSSSTVPCRFAVSLRSILAENASSSCLLKLPASRERRMLVARTEHGSGSLRLSGFDKLFFKTHNLEESLRSADALGGLRNGDSKVFSGNYSTYAVGGEEVVGSITENGESLNKVLISELPDESNGEHSAPISSCFWEWKPKLHVHYEKAGCENVKSPSVLFLPGECHCQLRILLCFQGKGLPQKGGRIQYGDLETRLNHGLMSLFSLWIYGGTKFSIFVEEVIGEPVYVVGNSLGGFVALYFAASNPQLVKGVTLLNATPFWGFLPNPIRSPRLAEIFPWSGTFPLPANVRKLTEFFWQKISDPKSIAEILKQVYTDHSTNIDKVFSRIIEITQHPAAAASFASIMFAPQGQLSFRETLARCKVSNIPICLMYGKEDPWVKPFWGLQVKQQVPEAPYYEVSPAGHCPHDEVPEEVVLGGRDIGV